MPNVTKAGAELLQPVITGVSVIIPCKNEELAVAKTVREVDAALASQNYDYEIIVVDDGSMDQTREEALAAGARVLCHGINLGYGNAIMNGMVVAKYPVIGILDADGTYPPEMLPEMIEQTNRFDMVVGSRQWNGHNTSCLGSLFRKLLYYIILYFGNVKAPDFNSGFRVFHRDNILSYRSIICPTFSFTTSLTMIYLMTSKTIKFIPIFYKERIGKSKVCYFRDALKTMSYVFLIANIFQPYRLSLFILLGCVLSNLLIFSIAALGGLGSATQIGMHITATGLMLMVMVALCINPIVRGYINKIYGDR